MFQAGPHDAVIMNANVIVVQFSIVARTLIIRTRVVAGWRTAEKSDQFRVRDSG